MDLLDRLEQAATRLGGTVRLNPPASPAELDDAERVMGVQLPDEVRQAYLRFNGTTRSPRIDDADSRVESAFFFIPTYDWVSLERMVSRWQDLQGWSATNVAEAMWPDPLSPEVLADATQNSLRSLSVGWHPRWIPIGDWGSSYMVLIDLAPPPAGRLGQLIYSIEGQLETEVAATSFNDFLERFLIGFESGELVPSKDGEAWVSARGLGLPRPNGQPIVFRLSDVGL